MEEARRKAEGIELKITKKELEKMVTSAVIEFLGE